MISREFVFNHLKEKQDSIGGYTSDDIVEIANILEVTPRGLRRQLNNWINTFDGFKQFTYLGKKRPSITLFEFGWGFLRLVGWQYRKINKINHILLNVIEISHRRYFSS